MNLSHARTKLSGSEMTGIAKNGKQIGRFARSSLALVIYNLQICE